MSLRGPGRPLSPEWWSMKQLCNLQVYTESTDGSYIESKESAVTWHYKDADPDFGRWQSKVNPAFTPGICCCWVMTLAGRSQGDL